MASKWENFQQIGSKVVAVGRNYKGMAKAQGNPIPDKPLVFLKPTSSYINEGQNIKIPEECKLFYHEVELGLVVGKTCSKVPESSAMDYIVGYVVALDMTARDFQLEAKEKGQPWCLSKAFDTACPVGNFIGKDKVSNPQDVRLWLKVNGEMKQDSSTSDMIFTIPHVISYMSKYITLVPGDLILTGSPAGAGPVKSGDVIEAGLADISSIKFKVDWTYADNLKKNMLNRLHCI